MREVEVLSKEIWVLDDEINMHHLTTNLVHCVDVDKEYIVKCFTSNLEVLDALNVGYPEIIFVDIDLKEDDGIVLLEILAKDNRFENVKVYVISNLIDRINLKRLMSTGLLTDYIPKPLELDDIKEILEK